MRPPFFIGEPMSGGYTVKVYIAQSEAGLVLAVKLTFAAAHAVAKAHAPARVLLYVADKDPSLSAPVPTLDQRVRS